MKRYTAVLAAASAGLFITANAAAYGLFCENSTAVPAMAGYADQMVSVSERFEAALTAPELPEGTEEAQPGETAADLYCQRMELYSGFTQELSGQEYSLAGKLIDYDLMLKRLEHGTGQYSKLKSNAGKLAAGYLVGECTKQEADEAEKQRSDKYFELESLLFEISTLKSDIESMTGETLKSDFDFSAAYLITDALKLSAEELSAWGAPGTICAPAGAETAQESSDITSQYTAAVKNYYALGEALRNYVDAARFCETAQQEYRLGTIPASQLEAAEDAFGEAKLAALSAKADYAKSLLELDSASGGALTAGSGVSGGLAEALRSVLPESLRGSGMWLTRRSGDRVMLSVGSMPVEFDPEKDSGEVEVSYNGTLLGTAAVGQGVVFEAPEPAEGVRFAEVVIRRNGKTAGKFRIDIYSPFGEFLEE